MSDSLTTGSERLAQAIYGCKTQYTMKMLRGVIASDPGVKAFHALASLAADGKSVGPADGKAVLRTWENGDE